MSTVVDLLARLEIVESGPSVDATHEQVAGVRDFLDGVADMSRELGMQSISFLFSPFALERSGRGFSPEVEARLEAALSRFESAYERRFSRSAIEWAALCDAGSPLVDRRRDLYAPVMSVIEARVPLMLRHGYLTVGDYSIPVSNWPNGYGRGVPSAVPQKTE